MLALWSLARYEPATWSKMIDIDQSAEANPIEHLLEEAIASVPAAVLYLLTTFRQQNGPRVGTENPTGPTN